MKTFSLLAVGLIFTLVSPGLPLRAESASVLSSFVPLPDGAKPQALVQGRDENFYGITQTGGQFNAGTFFRLSPAGKVTTLYSFPGDFGYLPGYQLLAGKDGNFYGWLCQLPLARTDLRHGGAVFKITPAGVMTILANFKEKKTTDNPSFLLQHEDGNFYGLTIHLETANRIVGGSVFKLTPGGVLTKLVQFDWKNGYMPLCLAVGRDGALYGLTYRPDPPSSNISEDLSAYKSTFFQVTTAGVFTTLTTFPRINLGPTKMILAKDGNFYVPRSSFSSGQSASILKLTPKGNLTTFVSIPNPAFILTPDLFRTSEGTFYGTTESGGATGQGTIYKLTPTGTLTTLLSFNPLTGIRPNSLVMGRDGTFYGTTRYSKDGSSGDNGAIFKLSTTGVASKLVAFEGVAPSIPQASLLLASDGNFYGTALAGSTVYRVTPGGTLTMLGSISPGNASELVEGSDGNFYGTVTDSNCNESLYRVTPQGVVTRQYNLGFISTGKSTAFTSGGDGRLYGISGLGGSGAIISFQPGDLAPKVEYQFTYGAPPGYNPIGRLLHARDGSFYGVTRTGSSSVYGALYRWNKQGVTSLHQFDSTEGYPTGILVEGDDGTIYGSTNNSLFQYTAQGGYIGGVSPVDTRVLGELDGLVPGTDGFYYGVDPLGGTAKAGAIWKVAVQDKTQTISFPAVASTKSGRETVLKAEASSGLPISYRVVSGPGTITADKLKATGPGLIVVKASQNGNALYQPAPPVQRQVVVK